MENDFEKATKHFEALGEMMASLSITMEDAADVFSRAFKRGFSRIDIEAEIKSVKNNPGLNRFQKWRIIRKLEKQKREMEQRYEEEEDDAE